MKAKTTTTTTTPTVTKTKWQAKTYVKPGVSQDQVLAAKASFDLFDSDHGGSIDINQIKAAMNSLGFQTKNASIYQLITELDADGSGAIDFVQWLDLMTRKVSEGDSRQKLKICFDLFDDERTGYISIKNLRRICQELGQNISEEQLQGMITRADLDGDGLVSQEEFYRIITKRTTY